MLKLKMYINLKLKYSLHNLFDFLKVLFMTGYLSLPR